MSSPIPDPGQVPDEPNFTDLPGNPDPLGDATTRPDGPATPDPSDDDEPVELCGGVIGPGAAAG